MPTLAGVALNKGLPTDACDRCGATDDAGRVTLSFPLGVLSSGQQVVTFCLCVWCQAELLGVSTGFKTGNALKQWYRVRRLTRQERHADNPSALAYLRAGRAVDK